jgi:hypothetical protein
MAQSWKITSSHSNRTSDLKTRIEANMKQDMSVDSQDESRSAAGLV